MHKPSQCRRAVLLDLDGTLVDPKRGIVAGFRHAVEALGGEAAPADALNWIIGPPLRASFATVLGPGGDIEAALAAYRARYVEGDGMFDADVYPEVPEVLAALAVDSRLFVCTSKPKPFAQRVLAHFGLDRHLKGVYGTGLDGTFDDKAELMAHLLACERFAPVDCVMVGDRRFDMEAARRNGVAGVGALWGYGEEAELTAAGAMALCARPGELAATIDSLAPIASFR